MSRYIDADALLKDFEAYLFDLADEQESISKSARLSLIKWCIDQAKTQPTADVREHIRGEWKEIDGDSGIWACPICGWTISLPTGNPQGQRCNFCQYCGSDLRAEGDDRDCFLCVHKKPDGCESWDCHFERKPLEVRNECF